MGKNKFSKETANAALTEIFNELTKMYKNTTVEDDDNFDYPIVDVYAEEWENYNNVQISLETEDDQYYVVQVSYDKDAGELDMNVLLDGLEMTSFQLDISDGIAVCDIVDMMVNAFDDIESYI